MPLVALAFVNRGRWVAFCPFGCGAANHLKDRSDTFTCDNPECRQGPVPLVWPSTEDMRAVEAALIHRPPVARNWNPDETIGYLLAENVEHGGFDSETGAVVGDVGADQSRAPALAALMVAGRELGA